MITYTTYMLELLEEERKAAIRFELSEESLVQLRLSRETFNGNKEFFDEDIKNCEKRVEENRIALDNARADIKRYFTRFGIGCQYAEFGN